MRIQALMTGILSFLIFSGLLVISAIDYPFCGIGEGAAGRPLGSAGRLQRDGWAVIAGGPCAHPASVAFRWAGWLMASSFADAFG